MKTTKIFISIFMHGPQTTIMLMIYQINIPPITMLKHTARIRNQNLVKNLPSVLLFLFSTRDIVLSKSTIHTFIHIANLNFHPMQFLLLPTLCFNIPTYHNFTSLVSTTSFYLHIHFSCFYYFLHIYIYIYFILVYFYTYVINYIYTFHFSIHIYIYII